MIEREHIDNTPFTIVTIEQGTFIAIGSRRITNYTTKEECMNMIECQTWDLITSTIAVMYEIMTENRNKN